MVSREMAQWVEGVAAKPDDINSKPETHMMEEEKKNTFHKLSSDLH